METELAAGERITAIAVPPPPPGGQAYAKVRDRASYAHGLAMVAVAGTRVALGAVAAKPWRLPLVEAAVAGRTLGDAAPVAGKIAAEGAVPLTHNAYKLTLARNLVKRAITGKAAS